MMFWCILMILKYSLENKTSITYLKTIKIYLRSIFQSLQALSNPNPYLTNPNLSYIISKKFDNAIISREKTIHGKNLPSEGVDILCIILSKLAANEESTIRMCDERRFHRGAPRVKYFIIRGRARTVKSLLSLRLYMTQKEFAYTAPVFSLLAGRTKPHTTMNYQHWRRYGECTRTSERELLPYAHYRRNATEYRLVTHGTWVKSTSNEASWETD